MVSKRSINVESDRVIRYSNKSKSPLQNNKYAMTIKYLLAMRRLSYAKAGKVIFGGITAQGVNAILNRKPESEFDDIFIDYVTEKLKVNRKYFTDLVEAVGEKINNEKQV